MAARSPAKAAPSKRSTDRIRQKPRYRIIVAVLPPDIRDRVAAAHAAAILAVETTSSDNDSSSHVG